MGTHYAASIDTLILSVGDGIVITAGYTKGNGNYMKIKHKSVYPLSICLCSVLQNTFVKELMLNKDR
ncbi:M23 family metallopeptidase [Melioribacter sp. OK-1-Me]|uniref:M23 family metallopeptidase n=1 Tax=Melioribacter sp. OK-1-Me TaxID=3461410 RepID=UPI004043C868